jgi:SAM-dependent methyltransferase
MNLFIEFYGKHRISPVSQDINDLSRHFSRRQSLYRQLGVLPALVRGRNVLEIGPGSGFNSLYIAALKPARYVLVEGNPAGLEQTANLLAAHGLLSAEISIVPSLIEDFESTEKFGLVLCEGMLSGSPCPEETLRQIASFVDDQGVLIITCVDAVSDFPESLRHLYAQAIIDPAASIEAQVDMLLPLFAPHLAHSDRHESAAPRLDHGQPAQPRRHRHHPAHRDGDRNAAGRLRSARLVSPTSSPTGAGTRTFMGRTANSTRGASSSTGRISTAF